MPSIELRPVAPRIDAYTTHLLGPERIERYQIQLQAVSAEENGEGEEYVAYPGNAVLAMSRVGIPLSSSTYRSCRIESLDAESENGLVSMATFAALVQAIKDVCLENNIHHLALETAPIVQWYTAFLEPGGFQECRCYRPGEIIEGIQTCLPLPTIRPQDVVLSSTPERVSVKSEYGEPFEGKGMMGGGKQGSGGIGGIHDVQHAQRVEPETFQTLSNNRIQPYIDRIIFHSNHFPVGEQIAPAQPPQLKKTHCTHWIRTGECEYIQQGCKYKHEIPADERIRESLGIREIPRWIRGDHALMRKHCTWALSPTAPPTSSIHEDINDLLAEIRQPPGRSSLSATRMVSAHLPPHSRTRVSKAPKKQNRPFFPRSNHGLHPTPRANATSTSTHTVHDEKPGPRVNASR